MVLPFSDRLSSLSMTISRSIHALAKGKISFFFHGLYIGSLCHFHGNVRMQFPLMVAVSLDSMNSIGYLCIYYLFLVEWDPQCS